MLVQLIEQELGMTVCGQADNIRDAMTLIEANASGRCDRGCHTAGIERTRIHQGPESADIGIPVLVLSMHEERLYAERVLRAGAKGFISKEESPAEVVAAIRKVLAGGIYVSQRVNEAILERLGQADQAVPIAPGWTCFPTGRSRSSSSSAAA